MIEELEVRSLRLKCRQTRALILSTIDLFLASPSCANRRILLAYLERIIDTHLEGIERLHRITLRFNQEHLERLEERAVLERKISYEANKEIS